MIRLPHSLAARLVLFATTAILLALLATGVAMDLALRRFIQGQVDSRLDTQILTVADALRVAPNGSLRLERSVDGPPFDRPPSSWVWEVLRSEGSISPQDAASPPADPVLRSRSLAEGAFRFDAGDPRWDAGPRPVTVDGSGPGEEPLRVRVQSRFVGQLRVTIAAGAPLRALAGPLHEILTPLVVTLLLLAAGLIGAVVFQVRLGLQPLTRLRAELHRVRTGRADRIAGPQPREVQPVVDELNSLLDQNALNLERARRHVANLAHGLKTPLATLALAFDEPGADPGRRLGPLVAGMDRLIRHHLARARAAALGGDSRNRVDLAATLADHVAVFGKLYADKGVAYEARLEPGVAVACEAQDLDEMLGNLLDNASKWTRARVLVTASGRQTRVELRVEDDGLGLPSGKAEHVMRLGSRIDETAPGYGFGLPITRELVELYGGTLTLGRSRLGGLLATLDLPGAA